jgi:DHA1 family bicyclomycin/chloramphenicol resistance-like MFS transporter
VKSRAEALPAAVLLVALSAMAPLSVDMFLPSLPSIRDHFHASDATVQLSVTLFLVAFASSQLFYGPASDRYGRRPLMTIGLVVYAIGATLAAISNSVYVLLGGRVLQGMGGGAGPALAQAIVLDVYGRQRAGKVLAYMSVALPLAPTIAPMIGGVLHDTLGWRSVFVVLLTFGVVLLTGYRILIPETNRGGQAERGFTGLASNYRTLLSSRTYVAFVLAMALMFSGHLVFIASSSFVLQDELGLGSALYGLTFGFVALGLMLGAMLSSRLAGRLRPEHAVVLGASFSTVAALVMASLAWSGVAEVAAVLGPMFFVAVGLGITRPAALAGALVPFPQIAGLASAFLGFTQILIASGYNIVYGATAGVSMRALASGVLIAVSAALASVLILRPGTYDIEARPAPFEAVEGSPN